MTVVAGVDFGTQSVRVSIFDATRGRLGQGIGFYPVLRSETDADHATQRHEDHLHALEHAFAQALAGRDAAAIEAIAIDATGSTVVPVDAKLQPIDHYYLWCDHRAWREAKEITEKARDLPALQYCGGVYSAEWGFAKLLHWLRHNPERRARFDTAVEHCDLMVATLCGISDRSEMPRSICAMGHKWMWNAQLGGLPPQDYLSSVDPLLDGVRGRLEGPYCKAGLIGGGLAELWARRLGVRSGTPVATGALDAHWDAVGAGCRLGDVINVLGTSSCIMATSPALRIIPGVSGIVDGSIHPHLVGIEAGLAAVGDLFDAIARRASLPVETLSNAISHYAAGSTGLIRLAWDNGDRCLLGDPSLRGITLGWRVHHTAADEFFAAVEGVAFHTRLIIDRLAAHEVPIDRVINGGGIPRRNARLNQVFADVLGRTVLVPTQDTTGLGAAIFAFCAIGAFPTVGAAQDALCPGYTAYEPEGAAIPIYAALFARFRELYGLLGKHTSANAEVQNAL